MTAMRAWGDAHGAAAALEIFLIAVAPGGSASGAAVPRHPGAIGPAIVTPLDDVDDGPDSDDDEDDAAPVRRAHVAPEEGGEIGKITRGRGFVAEVGRRRARRVAAAAKSLATRCLHPGAAAVFAPPPHSRLGLKPPAVREMFAAARGAMRRAAREQDVDIDGDGGAVSPSLLQPPARCSSVSRRSCCSARSLTARDDDHHFFTASIASSTSSVTSASSAPSLARPVAGTMLAVAGAAAAAAAGGAR